MMQSSHLKLSDVALGEAVLVAVAHVLEVDGVVDRLLVVGDPVCYCCNQYVLHHGCQMAKFDPILSLDCARVMA